MLHIASYIGLRQTADRRPSLSGRAFDQASDHIHHRCHAKEGGDLSYHLDKEWSVGVSANYNEGKGGVPPS